MVPFAPSVAASLAWALAASLAAFTGALGALAAQDPPTPPALEGVSEPLLASDEKPAVAGRIPENASAGAVERWHKLLAATRGDVQAPVTSFALTFEAELREENRFNTVDATFRFLDDPEGPFLSAHFPRKDRTSMRGPEGDYLITGTGPGRQVEPMSGRQWVEDRRQLNEWVVISQNFVALTRPDGVRLVSLDARRVLPEAGGDPTAATRVDFADRDPLELPDGELAALARGLEWLEVVSPDFRLFEIQGGVRGEPVFRALLGLDPASGEVRLAVLNEDRDGTIVIESALLVIVRRTDTVRPGYRVPGGLEVRRVDPTTSPWTFEDRAGVTLWLRSGGRLNPRLVANDFKPR